jgi:hypothetical protein
MRPDWWIFSSVFAKDAGEMKYPPSERAGVTSVAVGTVIAGRPPHRSVRAELPHTAPTLDGTEPDGQNPVTDGTFT